MYSYTDDSVVNDCLIAIDNIIIDLNNVIAGVQANIKNLGEENCIASLQKIVDSYTYIRSGIYNSYYADSLEKNN